MSTKGSLTDISLSEIFELIEKGHKTGLLKLCAFSKIRTTPLVFYIWVDQGSIVAAANRLDQACLVSLIAKHQGVRNRIVAELAQSCPLDQTLGLCLKNRFVLDKKQLKRLFQMQVLQKVCALFELKEGRFEFEQNVALPTREMTGLSVPLAAINQYCLLKAPLEELPMVTEL